MHGRWRGSVCPPSIDRSIDLSNNLRWIEITNWQGPLALLYANNADRLSPVSIRSLKHLFLFRFYELRSPPRPLFPITSQPRTRLSTWRTVCGISSTDFNCEFEDLISTRNFYNQPPPPPPPSLCSVPPPARRNSRGVPVSLDRDPPRWSLPEINSTWRN